jgi:hypothetical protein
MTTDACPLPAFTLFCDDLRQEAGGKLSAMGIYQGLMTIPVDAVLLPKLVAWTVLKFPVSNLDSQASVLLMDEERVLSSATLDFAHAGQLDADQAAADLARTVTTLNVPFVLAPFQAQAGMEIRVVFESPNFHYESDVLQIVKTE